MKINSAKLILLSAIIITSCGEQSTLTSGKPKTELTEEEQKMTLVESDIYDGDKIRLYLMKDTLNAGSSNQSFLNGLDLFKNKKKPQEAIQAFVTSITRYPTAKAYYELGNAYLETGSYEDALNAYEMAEKLNYEPFAKVLYNKACVYSQLKKYDQSARYLEYSVQAGYMNIDNINDDPDLKNLRTEEPYLFKRHLNLALDGVSNVENIYWLQYKKRFTQAKLPMSFTNVISGTRFNLENAISYDYERFIPEMRDEKFSREVSKGFYYFAQIADEKNFVALVYLIRDEFMGDQAPLSYCLVTYTPEGKMIDKHLIAGRESYTDLLKMSKINKDLTVVIDLMETEFEKDLEEHGAYDNPVKSKRKVGEEHLKIDGSGNIIVTTKETPVS